MRRVFDQDVYNTFMTKIGAENGMGGSIPEIDQENQGFEKWSGKQPTPVSMVEDYDTIHVYFNDLYNFQVQAKPKVEKIFKETQAADSSNGTKTTTLLERTDYYQDCLNILLRDIKPADGSAPYYPPEVISDNLRSYYSQRDKSKAIIMASYIVTEVRDENGNVIGKEYDWNRIEQVLHSEKLDMYERKAMVIVLQSMTTFKENKDGTVTVTIDKKDWDNIKRFAELCYETDVRVIASEVRGLGVPGTGVRDTTIQIEQRFTPAANIIIDEYGKEVMTQVGMASSLFALDGSKNLNKDQQMAVDYLKGEMLKLGVFNTLQKNSVITTETVQDAYSSMVDPDGDALFELRLQEAREKAKTPDIHITSEKEGKYYNVQIGDDIEKAVYPFSWNQDGNTTNVNIAGMDSMRRDKDLEQQISDDRFTRDMNILNATTIIGAVPGVGDRLSLAINAAYLLANKQTDDAARNQEIDRHNSKIDVLQENEKMINVYDAYAIGGVTYSDANGNTYGISVFNDSELELRARAYDQYLYDQAIKNGENPYRKITGADLKDMYNSKDPTERDKYVDWWNSVGVETTEAYKKELTKIAGKDPELTDERVESLTPAQIDQLDKQLKANSGGA